MKLIKRTRAVSHKKTTVTAAAVKVEFANQKRTRMEITNSPTKSKKHKSTESSHASEIRGTNTSEASGDAITLIISPKNKSDKLLKISKTKVHIPFRETKENFANLLPQMSKEIQSNFNKRYERRSDRNNDTTRRSDRHNNTTSNSRQHPIDINIKLNNSNNGNTFRDIHLVDYTRCYVEDYMLVEVGDIV